LIPERHSGIQGFLAYSRAWNRNDSPGLRSTTLVAGASSFTLAANRSPSSESGSKWVGITTSGLTYWTHNEASLGGR